MEFSHIYSLGKLGETNRRNWEGGASMVPVWGKPRESHHLETKWRKYFEKEWGTVTDVTEKLCTMRTEDEIMQHKNHWWTWQD